MGIGKWAAVARRMKRRTGKQCRERWINRINPDVKRGEWTEEEDQIIVEQIRLNGFKWALIARNLPGRTDNSVKNRFHGSLKHHKDLIDLPITPSKRPRRTRKQHSDDESDESGDLSEDEDDYDGEGHLSEGASVGDAENEGGAVDDEETDDDDIAATDSLTENEQDEVMLQPVAMRFSKKGRPQQPQRHHGLSPSIPSIVPTAAAVTTTTTTNAPAASYKREREHSDGLANLLAATKHESIDSDDIQSLASLKSDFKYLTASATSGKNSGNLLNEPPSTHLSPSMHQLSLSYASPHSSPTVSHQHISFAANSNSHHHSHNNQQQQQQQYHHYHHSSSLSLSDSNKSKRHGSDSLTLLASLPLISDTTTATTSGNSNALNRRSSESPKTHRHQSWPYAHQRSSPNALVSPPHSPATTHYQPLMDPNYSSSSHRSFSSVAPSPGSSPHQSPLQRHLSPLPVRQSLPSHVSAMEYSSQASMALLSAALMSQSQQQQQQQQQQQNGFSFSMPSRTSGPFSTDNNRYSLAATQLTQQQQQQTIQSARAHAHSRSYSEPADGSPRVSGLSPNIPTYPIQSTAFSSPLSQSLPSSPISPRLPTSPSVSGLPTSSPNTSYLQSSSPTAGHLKMHSGTMPPLSPLVSKSTTATTTLKASLSSLPSISSLHLPQPTSLPKSRLSEEHPVFHM